MRKTRERPSAEERRKFSIICGEKTTTQQAMEIELSESISDQSREKVGNAPADTTHGLEV